MSDAPSQQDREQQLDQLISLWLKHTLEKAEKIYNENSNHHISTTTTMLKVHDNILVVENELIKKTHVRHEKQNSEIIERLSKSLLSMKALQINNDNDLHAP